MPSTDSKIPLLTLDNISKSFANVPVLKDINLKLEEGEILFLLGASGCGKTTLLRTIAGFEPADKGKMWICDKLIFDHKHSIPPRKRHLGYVVQEGVLFPHLSVYRNIGYGLGNGKGKAREDRKRIEKVMKLTDIAPLAKRMPHEISGGQQQRVALARALVLNPTIMLLDEPFSALDEHLRAKIRTDVIHILRRSNAAAIVVTHDRHEALSSADKIGLIDAGRLVQLDTPERIFNRPNTPEIARFISENSILLDADLTERGCCVKTALAGRIPVEIFDNGYHNLSGKLLIRSDQLKPVAVDDTESLFPAAVKQIQFHGTHRQIDMLSGDTPISLDVNSNYDLVNVGDKVGLKLLGKGLFYPEAS